MAAMHLPRASRVPYQPGFVPPPPSYDAAHTDDEDRFHYAVSPRYPAPPVPGYEDALRIPALASYDDLIASIRERLIDEMDDLYARKTDELAKEFRQPVQTRREVSGNMYSHRRLRQARDERATRMAQRYRILSEYSQAIEEFRTRISQERTVLAAHPQLKSDVVRRFEANIDRYTHFLEMYERQKRE
jgi:hypothetical protein